MEVPAASKGRLATVPKLEKDVYKFVCVSIEVNFDADAGEKSPHVVDVLVPRGSVTR